MAAFGALKSVVANRGGTGAVAVLTGFLSSGIIYAGKKAIAAERELAEAASREGSDDGRSGLACAPQFDGLECFETIVRTGKQPSTVKASGNDNWNLSLAPQFDGLECFETIVSTGKHPSSVKQPSTAEKSAPQNRGLALAPQFDGLHCFETIISRK